MLRGIDGADHWGNGANMIKGAAYADNGLAPSTSRPRNGTHSFRTTSPEAGPSNRRVIPADATATVGFGAAYFVDVLPSSSRRIVFCQWRDNANSSLVAMLLSTTGQILIVTGDTVVGPVIGETDPGVFVAGTYQHVEWRCAFAGASGGVEVRVNGQTVLTLSNVNIGSAGAARQFRVGCVAGISGVGEYCYDDSYWWDDAGSLNNDFLGDHVVRTFYPSADTAEAGWTPNTGATGYTQIDETTPDDDTTYVSSADASPLPVSEYELPDMPSSVTSIAGVMVHPYARKIDSGTGSYTVDMVGASGVSAGSEVQAAGTYGWAPEVHETNPDTSAPWSPAEWNACAKVQITRNT